MLVEMQLYPGMKGRRFTRKLGVHSSRFLRDVLVHYAKGVLQRVGSGVWGSRGDAVQPMNFFDFLTHRTV